MDWCFGILKFSKLAKQLVGGAVLVVGAAAAAGFVPLFSRAAIIWSSWAWEKRFIDGGARI